MKVQILRSLSRSLGSHMEGDEIDVDRIEGEALIKQGLAVSLEPIKAVPVAPAIAEAAEPVVEIETPHADKTSRRSTNK